MPGSLLSWRCRIYDTWLQSHRVAGIGEDLEVKRECERGGDIVHKKHGDCLGGGFKYLLCSPVLREMINFDLFEMG